MENIIVEENTELETPSFMRTEEELVEFTPVDMPKKKING